MRQGLRQILSDSFRGAVFGEAGNAKEALDRVSKGAWDVAILDISMPGRSGLDLLREIRRIKPQLPVLFLSMHPEDQYGMRVLKSGASGYMNKECAPQELVGAIRKILAGGRYVSSGLVEKMAMHLASHSSLRPHELLSDREFQVMRSLAAAKTVGQIAEELCLSVKTISTYRRRILEKTGLKNNAELMRYALEHSLVG